MSYTGKFPTSLFKRHFDITLGKMLQPAAVKSEDQLHPYLRAANIEWGSVNSEDLKKMYFSKSDLSKYTVDAGDLVVLEGGDVGRASIVPQELAGAGFQNSVHRVRAKKDNDLRFAFFWLQYLKSTGYFELICSKATLAHFTSEKFAISPFPRIDPPSQKRIAAFLDRETARIDQLIDKKNSLVSTLNQSMQTMIATAVTGSHDDNLRTLRVTNNQRSHFDLVADGWTQRTMRSAIRSYGSQKNKDEHQTVLSLTKGGVKVKTNLAFGKSTESYIGHQMVHPDQMVFTPRDFDATPILCGVSKNTGCISNLYIVFDVADHINPKFLEYYLWGLKYGYNFFNKLSFGMRFSFNKGQFERIPLIHPNREIQDQIVKHLDQKISVIRDIQEKTKASINKLKEYRASLITAAVTGQIDVTTWKRDGANNDHSASDLEREIA